MSGRILAQDVIDALYRAVGDDRLAWLDGLLIDAGLMRRCPCTAMAPADGICPRCGGGTDDYFDIYRCRPEAEYTIDALTEADPVLQIRIAAAGGGEIGDKYASNHWIYSVWLDSALWQSGNDLRSGSTGKTHAQMAAILADTLACRHPPTALTDRLTTWAHDQQEKDRDD